MSNSDLIFGKGIIQKSGVYIFDVALVSNEEKDIQHTIILIYENDEWNYWEIDKRVVDFIVIDNHGNRIFQGISEDGYSNTDSSGHVWKHIDPNEGGPNHLKHMTSICLLDNHYYAAGMTRMVYRKRINEANWVRFDEGIRYPSKDKEITGFVSIDGVSSEEIYAVGYDGDIWWCDNGNWREVESPTNVVLNSIKSCSDGLIYICGNNGVVLKGRHHKWEVIENTVTEEDFWSIEEYNQSIYLATDMMPLYNLVNDSIQEVSTSLDCTTGWLNARDGKLLSVGEHDIFIFDGVNWNEIVVPPNE